MNYSAEFKESIVSASKEGVGKCFKRRRSA